MARPEFQQVVAQAPKKKLQTFTSSIATPVTQSGGADVTYLYAPANFVGKIVNFYASMPQASINGATSGNPRFMVGVDVTLRRFYYDYPYNVTMSILHGWITVGSNPATRPAVECPKIEQLSTVLQDLYFDDSTPLMFRFENWSNADITGTRLVKCNYLLEEVAK